MFPFRTKATANLYDTLRALDLGDNIITKAQDNSGPWNGFMRWLNQRSGGVIGISPELAATDNAVSQYSSFLARAMNSGKTTNQTIQDAKNISAFKGRSAQENTARMGENQNIALHYLAQQINELQALGGRVPPDVVQSYLKHRARAQYIQQHRGIIDVNTYHKVGIAPSFNKGD
ncbi:hypothetical protein [Helicobacter salomonis]|uniref:hypothetical protein n=1 Tax=Helicobacter salomonis TaxID=56878 RepID=UPI000CF15EE4|nr:hypothetical protein [Helicobacter salomonis]